MAEEKEIKIVIRARDEFSTEIEKASRAAEGATANIKKSMEGASAASSSAGLKEYEAALKKVMALEETAANRKKEALEMFAALGGRNAYAASADAESEAREAQTYQNKLGAMYAYNAAVVQSVRDTNAAKAAMDRDYYDQSMGSARKERDFRISCAAETYGAIANFWQNLYVATGKNNRRMFEIMKAFAVAETVIATYSSAQKAFDKGISETGSYWGGVAYAAAATVAGMARVAEIQRQKPADTGGSISAGGAANPSYLGGSPSAYPVPQRLEGEGHKSPQQVTVNIYNPLSDQNWQRIAEDNIIPALNNAADRNVNITVKNMGTA